MTIRTLGCFAAAVVMLTGLSGCKVGDAYNESRANRFDTVGESRVFDEPTHYAGPAREQISVPAPSPMGAIQAPAAVAHPAPVRVAPAAPVIRADRAFASAAVPTRQRQMVGELNVFE